MIFSMPFHKHIVAVTEHATGVTPASSNTNSFPFAHGSQVPSLASNKQEEYGMQYSLHQQMLSELATPSTTGQATMPTTSLSNQTDFNFNDYAALINSHGSQGTNPNMMFIQQQPFGTFAQSVSCNASSATATNLHLNDCFPQQFNAVMPPARQPGLPPLRALTAYNFFFCDERERLLYGGGQIIMEVNDEKCERLLIEQDRTTKRRHRKTHGKIPFTELSKIVSKKWKELSNENKEFYCRVSAKDWKRYQKELDEQKQLQAWSTSSMALPNGTPMASDFCRTEM
jgi:HMG (high mobility group) box